MAAVHRLLAFLRTYAVKKELVFESSQVIDCGGITRTDVIFAESLRRACSPATGLKSPEWHSVCVGSAILSWQRLAVAWGETVDRGGAMHAASESEMPSRAFTRAKGSGADREIEVRAKPGRFGPGTNKHDVDLRGASGTTGQLARSLADFVSRRRSLTWHILVAGCAPEGWTERLRLGERSRAEPQSVAGCGSGNDHRQLKLNSDSASSRDDAVTRPWRRAAPRENGVIAMRGSERAPPECGRMTRRQMQMKRSPQTIAFHGVRSKLLNSRRALSRAHRDQEDACDPDGRPSLIQ